MRVVKQGFQIERIDSPEEAIALLARAGRTCYQREVKDFEDALAFVRKIINLGHESVIEHSLVSVRLITSRGVTHELVRHRLASYSQESTRYCRYEDGITVILPVWAEVLKEGEFKEPPPGLPEMEAEWLRAMLDAERHYLKLLELGASPQFARGALPVDVKTEIVVSANFREWRHIFKLRGSSRAHPQIRELMQNLKDELARRIPAVFDDL